MIQNTKHKVSMDGTYQKKTSMSILYWKVNDNQYQRGSCGRWLLALIGAAFIQLRDLHNQFDGYGLLCHLN